MKIAEDDNIWELYNGESTNNRELNTPLPTVGDFEEMAQLPIPDDSLDYDEILDTLDECDARKAPKSPQPGPSHRLESPQAGPSHRLESPQPRPSQDPDHTKKRKKTDDDTRNPNKRTLFESR